jgi:hypothetical protein
MYRNESVLGILSLRYILRYILRNILRNIVRKQGRPTHSAKAVGIGIVIAASSAAHTPSF